jgi:hypothetical protein
MRGFVRPTPGDSGTALTSSEACRPVAQIGAETVDGGLWEQVGRLVDRARSPGDLRAHRLHAIAAWHWREQGRLVPSDFAEEAHSAKLASLVAPLVLSHVRAACDGPILVFKGPEVAARYPSRSMRPFGDLDLLVREPRLVQRALIGAGFVEVGDEEVYRDIHHLRPLYLEGFPLVLEIHARPKWPAGVRDLDLDELFQSAVPSVVAIEGVSALPAAQHALLLAAHAWAHAPLARLFHLVDIAVVRGVAPADEISTRAKRWGLGRVWETTSAAIDDVLQDRRGSWPSRTWARHLRDVREQTVFETHVGRWLAGFSALPPGAALRKGLDAVARDVRPAREETWGDKWFRSRRAVANAGSPRSRHEIQVERALRRRRLMAGRDPQDSVRGDDES